MFAERPGPSHHQTARVFLQYTLHALALVPGDDEMNDRLGPSGHRVGAEARRKRRDLDGPQRLKVPILQARVLRLVGMS